MEGGGGAGVGVSVGSDDVEGTTSVMQDSLVKKIQNVQTVNNYVLTGYLLYNYCVYIYIYIYYIMVKR